MAKSIKLKNDYYLSTEGISHNKQILNQLLHEHLILLWNNSNPKEMNSGYEINLNSNNYDMLLCLFATNISVGNGCLSSIALKGKDMRLISCDSTGTVAYRNLEYVTDSKFVASDGTQAGNVQARRNVPLSIYGIKLFS